MLPCDPDIALVTGSATSASPGSLQLASVSASPSKGAVDRAPAADRFAPPRLVSPKPDEFPSDSSFGASRSTAAVPNASDPSPSSIAASVASRIACLGPWLSPPAAALATSCNGRIRSSAHGVNAASSTSVAPVRTEATPGIVECPSAEPPSDRTATIANLERISAISVSIARIASVRRAGQTIAAKNIGSISTIT